MIKHKSNRNYFKDEDHLNDEHIALYAEALIVDKVEALPAPVLEHVEDCMKCKTRILELYDIMKTREEIYTQNSQFFNTKTINLKYQWIKMAAVFLGLIAVAVSLYLYFSGASQNYQRLYAQNFDPYMDVITERSNASSTFDTLFNAILAEHYNKGDYDGANPLFENLYKPGNTGDTLLFYYGVSSLASSNYEKAIHLFNELSFFKESIFYEQSRWYLALAYLNAAANSKGKNQQEWVSKCKDLLRGIVDHNMYAKDKAQVLLKKM